jgi:hypothetical protein
VADEFVGHDNPLDGKTVWRGRDEYVEFMRTWTSEFRDWSIRGERLSRCPF